MTRAPLISALVRSMDRPTLDRALASIALQEYPAVEVVVVAANGAAHRDLPNRCGAFPLRLVRGGRLARAGAANAALDAAAGERLAFLDDDDEWLPAHLRTLADALDADPDARLVYSRCEDLAADGRVLGLHGEPFKPWRQLDSGFVRGQCALFARSLLDEGARFDPQFDVLEDMDFFIQCAQRTRFAFVERVTVRYYAEAGDSGVGAGSNRDPARMAAPLAQLRAKWSALEATLRATPEFRAEQALWFLQQGRIGHALPIAQALLDERPDDADALALWILLLALRGDLAGARQGLLRIGDRVPRIDDLARHVAALRVRLAPA